MSSGKEKYQNRWGNCSFCMHERPVRDGIVKAHNVYVHPFDTHLRGIAGTMIPCPGSEKAPLTLVFHSIERKTA